jgi:hypothetical protein
LCEEAGRSWLISVLSVSWLRIVMARQIARSDCPKHEKKNNENNQSSDQYLQQHPNTSVFFYV